MYLEAFLISDPSDGCPLAAFLICSMRSLLQFRWIVGIFLIYAQFPYNQSFIFFTGNFFSIILFVIRYRNCCGLQSCPVTHGLNISISFVT